MNFPKKLVIRSEVLKPTKFKGFTIIELMVTVSVAAILASIALPNLTALMTKYRLTNENTDLMLDFVSARSEAATRSTRITVCQSSDGLSCSTGGWDTGHIVFVDKATIGSVDAGDEILRVSAAIKSGDTMASSTADTSVTYDASGSPSANFTISTCKSGYSGAKVIIYPTGRVRSDKIGTCP
jgi:type IV fimbrial biogenesis protein FimT